MMMRTYVLWVFLLFAFLLTAPMVNADIIEMEWKDVSRGIRDTDLQAVTIDTERGDIVYASSVSSVYRTSDGGSTWDEILSFRGTGKGINTITIAPADPERVFAGTDDGVYRSNDRGLNWERIFKGVGTLENSVLAIAVHPHNSEIIHIGTLRGIFTTENNGDDWVKGQNLSSEAIVTSISADPATPEIIYAATDMGVYKSLNGGKGWERIFASTFPEKDHLIPSLLLSIESGEEYYNEIKSQIKEKIKVKNITVDPVDSRMVYAGTYEGLFVSRDRGTTWSTASISGLLSRDIRHISVDGADPDSVYAATSRGVFRYSKSLDAWKGLYKGLPTSDIRYLAISHNVKDRPFSIWAATKRGISRTVAAEQHDNSRQGELEAEDVLSRFAYEPSIEEIRAAAIEYADVHPDKISNWRKAAANKAWLPDLNMRYGNGEDWQSSTYFYSTKDYKYKDDDVTSGNDEAWSISLTWQLGDIIWNSAQTSIDNRSKLMVQLRDDVLNEVTRIYYERRRLQIDIFMSPPADMKSTIEKDLRLQELTANIDALTGTYLSKRLAQAGIRAQGQE